MKQFFLLTTALTMTLLSFSQTDTNTELVANIIIRDDRGTEFENKNVTIVFKNLSSKNDLRNCTGFLFIPYGNSKLEMLNGFTCVVTERQSWKYAIEYSDNTKTTYYTKCRFGLMLKSSTNIIDTNPEIIYIKYSNGSQTIMIVGYDNNNTLVIKI
jgi:hypothetical protein